MAKCIFSVDVEDWFHILELPSSPRLEQWASLPSRVEKNFLELLDIFASRDVRTTCFFLGWVGEHFPHLVRRAALLGHEIASHGYSHRPADSMTAAEFRQDAAKAKCILENDTGNAVFGYRAAGFSATPSVPWFFDELAEAGYRYDSSSFPARRAHGGWAQGERAPHTVGQATRQIIEIPITVRTILGTRVCFFGGGYLRLFPFPLIHRMAAASLRDGLPVVFYVHPREIDPEQPRLSMSARRAFKTYINLSTTRTKIERLLDCFEFTTFQRYIEEDFLGRPLAVGCQIANDRDRQPVPAA